MQDAMQAGGYTVDVLVQGFPGKTVCHGGLGWSSIVLLRGHGRVALVDVGAFGHARIAIGAVELEWSVAEPWGETPVPELYVRELLTWPTVVTVADGEEVLPGITPLPGHRPAWNGPATCAPLSRGSFTSRRTEGPT